MRESIKNSIAETVQLAVMTEDYDKENLLPWNYYRKAAEEMTFKGL